MNKTTLPEKKFKQAKSPPLDQDTTYHVNDRSFVVQPVSNMKTQILLEMFCFVSCRRTAKRVCNSN